MRRSDAFGAVSCSPPQGPSVFYGQEELVEIPAAYHDAQT